MEKDGVWQENFTVDTYMVDTNRAIRLTSICNFLQVVAGNHAHSRGLGFDDMIKNNQFWIMSRMRVEMDSFPQWRSTVTVHTWVSDFKGPFSFRNFEIYESDTLIGSASTLWVAIDGTSRRPARVVTADFPILFGKVPKSGNADKIKKCQFDNTSTFNHKIVYSDLDMVKHTNNVKYIEWILDSYPALDTTKKPHFIELNYLSETRLGNAVSIFSNQLKTNQYQHEIQLTENATPVLRAILHWR